MGGREHSCLSFKVASQLLVTLQPRKHCQFFKTVYVELNCALKVGKWEKKEENVNDEMGFKVCEELKEGAMALLALHGGRGYESLRALSDTLELPLISLNPPSFPADPPNKLVSLVKNKITLSKRTI